MRARNERLARDKEVGQPNEMSQTGFVIGTAICFKIKALNLKQVRPLVSMFQTCAGIRMTEKG